MPSHLHLAHRRTARNAARGRIVKTDDNLEEIRQRCREDFAFFCDYVSEGKKKPAAHHLEWIDQLVTNEDSSCLHRIASKDTVILAPRGPLAISMPVATPRGWVPIGELHIGDLVYTEKGQLTHIVGISDYDESPTWEVVFSDGSNVRCDSQHLWKVRRIGTDGNTEWSVKTLRDIQTAQLNHESQLTDKPWLDSNGNPLYEIPVTAAVEYPETKLSLDPYVYGQLCAISKDDMNISAEYLRGSLATRRELFRGLMDTAGSIKDNGELEFSSSLIGLTTDVIELVQSLGGTAKTWECTVSNQNKIRISLPNSVCPFTFDHKIALYNSYTRNLPCRGIVDIKPSFPEKVRCIEVADECHTFLTKDYIVTHNSAKSTITGLFTAWAIGIHAEKQLPLKILYISYTVDVARPKSAAIKNTICTKRYQEIFPSVRLKKGATSNEYWSIDYKHAGIEETGDEQFTLCCAGLKGSITSKRSHLCLIDDCIKSAAEIANPEIRKIMQDNWNSVIAPTMFEGARAICLGTRFRHDDLFATTFIEANGWRQIVQQALITDDQGNFKSYWPEMWSVDYLLKKKKTAPISFSFQYMNQIVRQSELSLSPDLLIRSEIATEFDTIGIGVDLSSGLKEKNDYTVMTLGGRIGDKIHIIDYRRFRVMGNLEKLDKMMELLADWNLLVQDEEGRYYPTMNVCDIWSEAVQYQASLEADFKRICLNEYELHNLKWHPVKGFRSDKLARFRGIMGMFEQRKIVFNRYRGFMSMFDELTNFGTSSHDDCVDSLVHLVNGLMRRGSIELDY